MNHMMSFPAILPFIDIGMWEWVIIIVVAVLLFGNRLPDLGRTLGKGLVSFRKGVSEMKDEIAKAASEPVKPEERSVPTAGHDTPEAGAGLRFSVLLLGAGANKIELIKAVREVAGLGLEDAKTLVDATPSTVCSGINAIEAEKIKATLEAAGGRVELRS